MTIKITDEDISYAEQLLLPEGHSFNEERRAFIRCMESRDVVACPGSGKTTALMAKLLILARKMPFEDGRGICVLTHTNVAIDEIKKRAGIAADSLFRYPNFFGTIQSFVNKFLAIPAYRSEFKKPIVSIDKDRFHSEISKRYYSNYGLQRWLEKRGGIKTLEKYWLHPETLAVGKSIDEKISRLGEGTDTYKKICDIRHDLLEKGILSYNDAYSIALRYILKNPNIHHSFLGRFCMIFLDEAQDTYEHQFRVLNQIIPSEQLIVQRIGDPNQAIFNTNVGNTMIWKPRSPLYFSDSHRYGDEIASILCSVRVHNEISLKTNQNSESKPPQILTFLPGEEQQVIKAFGELIHHHGISQGIYSAIGWIGIDKRSEDKICIPTYFPQYDKLSKQSRNYFPNLISYSAYALQNANLDSLKQFYDIIIQGIVRTLSVSGIINEESGRNHTSKSVQKYWKYQNEDSYSDFREKIVETYLLALESSINSASLRDIICASLKCMWTISNSAGQNFLTDNTIDQTIRSEITEGVNEFVSDHDFVINVGTVHSVKGETHTATLYLETYYQKKTDSQRLMNFLKGDRPKQELRKVYHQQNLKMAHVAFSRPKQLLVFACQKSTISGHEKGLLENGWEIHSVSEILEE